MKKRHSPQPYKFKNGDRAKMLMYELDFIPEAVRPLMDENNMVTGKFTADHFKCCEGVFLWHFHVDNCNVAFMLGDQNPTEEHGFYERIETPCTNHNWQDQQTGTVLIHKICTRCGAEKFE